MGLAIASDENKVDSAAKSEDLILVKIVEEEFAKVHTEISNYIGVSYNKRESNWRAQRWSKKEKKIVHSGCFKDEEKAARGSDTLARNLMENGEMNHKLNFPDDNFKVE